MCALIIVLLLSLQGIRIHADWNEYYCDKNQTRQIEGIFVILVFICHFSSYASFNGLFGEVTRFIIVNLQQCVVSVFLFYSGYGIMKKSNDLKYIHNLPRKAVRLLLQVDLAILLFIPLNLYFHKSLSLKKIILSFLLWDDIGNSNWYIFAIIYLYMITFISFFVCELLYKQKNNEKRFMCFAIFVLIFCVIYILIMRKIKKQH